MHALKTPPGASHFACSTLFLGLAVWVMAGTPLSMNAQPKYTIAYSGFAPLNTDIFIADADGRNPKPFLASPALDFNASFSRDGKWIVFTSERNGSADIYRAHVDGTGLEQLTNDPSFDDQAALSPDGRTLAFISTRSGHAELWTLDLPARKLHNITNHAGGHFRPAWSPDGKWIAISSDRDSPNRQRPDGFEPIQQTEIYVMHPDGSGFRRLTHTNSYAGSPSWSPDGKQVVFYKASFEDVISISDPRHLRATTQIAIVDVASGQEKELTQGKGEKWSPQWIAAGRIGYFSGGPEGGAEFISAEFITGGRKGDAGARGEFNSPHWSPYGHKMVYYRDIGQNWPPVMETPSKDSRFRLLRTGIFPSFSPAGDRLVFTNGQAALSHNGLVEASVDGSNRWLIHDDLQRNTTAELVSNRRLDRLWSGRRVSGVSRHRARNRDHRAHPSGWLGSKGAYPWRSQRRISELVSGRKTHRFPNCGQIWQGAADRGCRNRRDDGAHRGRPHGQFSGLVP